MAQRSRRTLSIRVPEAIPASEPGESLSVKDTLDRIEALFNAIGTDQNPDTILPAGNKNNHKEAAEFALAERLKKLAENRFKKAAEAAKEAGVLGDEDNYRNGETVMVWQCPDFSVSVKSGNPSKQIGKEEVKAAADKFLGRKSADFMKECFKDRAPTRQIIVSMK